jgi:hypothetical protein
MVMAPGVPAAGVVVTVAAVPPAIMAVIAVVSMITVVPAARLSGRGNGRGRDRQRGDESKAEGFHPDTFP